ncbi:metallophosphoesterase [Sporosarcina sp. HYO08]|uniref:metallophosphoesterase n=1 Tax=Sporosarcina sp. HYO08 TaxID=1759557 RepID=UPI00079C42AB|nr:metallophosphoesterase [Sporosarcina sp. HYO08]KXH82041.1 hypothetical protein AU377_07255 [Sporosarcina sp. HYO08]
MITFKKIVWTSLSFIFGFFLFMFINARKRNVITQEMIIGTRSKQAKKLSVFFISDIHRRKIDEKLVSKVLSQEKPDVVIVGGDLAEKGVPLARIEQNVQQLSELGPLFYVWGNNDREVSEQAIRDIMKRRGGSILDNEIMQIPKHPSWGICGIDDPSSGKVDIGKAVQYSENYENMILVTHNPSLFRKVSNYIQPDLMLAGHTHGGQIRIGKFGLAEKGTFQVNEGSGQLISNGYGTSTLPLRLGADPECHLITIIYGG